MFNELYIKGGSSPKFPFNWRNGERNMRAKFR